MATTVDRDPDPQHPWAVRPVASAVALVAGLWLLITPAVLHGMSMGLAIDSAIVGLAVIALEGVRLFLMDRSTAALSWMAVVLGLWAMAAPFFFETLGATPWNVVWPSIITGLVIAAFGAWSATGDRLRRRPIEPGLED